MLTIFHLHTILYAIIAISQQGSRYSTGKWDRSAKRNQDRRSTNKDGFEQIARRQIQSLLPKPLGAGSFLQNDFHFYVLFAKSLPSLPRSASNIARTIWMRTAASFSEQVSSNRRRSLRAGVSNTISGKKIGLESTPYSRITGYSFSSIGFASPFSMLMMIRLSTPVFADAEFWVKPAVVGLRVEASAKAAENSNFPSSDGFLFFIEITMPTVLRSAQIGMKGCRQTVAFLIKFG